MPTYVYKDENSDKTWEVQQAMADDAFIAVIERNGEVTDWFNEDCDPEIKSGDKIYHVRRVPQPFSFKLV